MDFCGGNMKKFLGVWILSKEKEAKRWIKYPLSFPNRMDKLSAAFGYVSPQSAIHHQGVRGQEIHQNSLCNVRYTKEPLRIRGSLLCLWPPTLRPWPSSPVKACSMWAHQPFWWAQTKNRKCSLFFHWRVSPDDQKMLYLHFFSLFPPLDSILLQNESLLDKLEGSWWIIWSEISLWAVKCD